ncbi:MAG: cytochrome c3 family protein, partial [Gemmatimonadetes bacterium]|nr:cytochrome c3 family protein [Gemmatimonadota bacterium]
MSSLRSVRFGRAVSVMGMVAAVIAGGGCEDRAGSGRTGDASRDAAGSVSVGTDAHAGLACADCHAGARDRSAALAGGSGLVPAAGAESCRGCHPAAELSPRVSMAFVSFPHADHGGTPDGTAISCGACHTHASGDAPLGLSEAACYLCHADLAPDREAVGGGDAGPALSEATIPGDACITCHTPAHVTQLASGAVIEHAEILERGISCTLCHFDVTSGTGAVPDQACNACHGVRPGLSPRPDRSGDAAAIHAAHATGGDLSACERCHDPVRHEVEAVASSLDLDCRTCHGPAGPPEEDPATHRAVQQLFAGIVPGVGMPPVPSAKFGARVACGSCHGDGSAATMATMATTEARDAVAASCAGCHGEGFEDLLADWLAAFDRRVPAVGKEIARAEADSRVTRAAPERVAAARRAWEAVHEGLGVHNPAAAHDLLLRARRELDAAHTEARVPFRETVSLGPSPAEQTCARCHYGHEFRAASGDFAHGPHVLKAGIECARCHGNDSPAGLVEWAEDPHHGAVTVSAADCRSCHHADGPEARCATCHAGAGNQAAPVNVLVRSTPRMAQWSHADHASVACADCHAGERFPLVTAEVASCTACHDSHHEAAVNCAGCHSVSSLSGSHTAATHRACD